MITTGTELKALVALLKIPHTHAAKAAGIAPSTLSRYYAGYDRGIPQKTVTAILDYASDQMKNSKK